MSAISTNVEDTIRPKTKACSGFVGQQPVRVLV